MKKRIQEYIKNTDKLLDVYNPTTDYNKLLKRHMTEIEFFMHERLIHLIVTVTFAMLTLISLCCFCVYQYYTFAPLVILFFVLLIPYIFHYYILENGVQKMYNQYDTIIEFIEKQDEKQNENV